jgi:hypothetical protein
MKFTSSTKWCCGIIQASINSLRSRRYVSNLGISLGQCLLVFLLGFAGRKSLFACTEFASVLPVSMQRPDYGKVTPITANLQIHLNALSLDV